MNPEVSLAASFYRLYVDLASTSADPTTSYCDTPPPVESTNPAAAAATEEKEEKQEKEEKDEFAVWQDDEWTTEDEREAQAILDQASYSSAAAGSSSASHTWSRSSSSSSSSHHGHQLYGSHQPQQNKEKQKRDFSSSSSLAWDRFYQTHQAKFFKDRHYLATEFPLEFGGEGRERKQQDEGNDDDDYDGDNERQHTATTTTTATTNRCLVEIGCGVGNALLPLLNEDEEHDNNNRVDENENGCDDFDDDDPHAQQQQRQKHGQKQRQKLAPWTVYGLDVSSVAIDILQREPRFLRAARQGRAHARCCDISNSIPVEFMQVATVATLLFCLSAIHPMYHTAVAHNVASTLAPGGVLVVRDYGRYDQAQLQLAARQQLRQRGGRGLHNSNFYRKQDGTCCYYFTTEDLERLFGGTGTDTDGAGLQVLQLEYIRRSYRNRSTNETRRRVWVQARFLKKPP